jgi:hypothetical protein
MNGRSKSGMVVVIYIGFCHEHTESNTKTINFEQVRRNRKLVSCNLLFKQAHQTLKHMLCLVCLSSRIYRGNENIYTDVWTY